MPPSSEEIAKKLESKKESSGEMSRGALHFIFCVFLFSWGGSFFCVRVWSFFLKNKSYCQAVRTKLDVDISIQD